MAHLSFTVLLSGSQSAEHNLSTHSRWKFTDIHLRPVSLTSVFYINLPDEFWRSQQSLLLKGHCYFSDICFYKSNGGFHGLFRQLDLLITAREPNLHLVLRFYPWSINSDSDIFQDVWRFIYQSNWSSVSHALLKAVSLCIRGPKWITYNLTFQLDNWLSHHRRHF